MRNADWNVLPPSQEAIKAMIELSARLAFLLIHKLTAFETRAAKIAGGAQ